MKSPQDAESSIDDNREENFMGLFSTLKRNSKLALRESWGRAIIILLILVGVYLLITAVTQIAAGMFMTDSMLDNPAMQRYYTASELAGGFRFGAAEWIVFGSSVILSILLIAPLTLGQARWYYNLVHVRSMPVTELFYYFETGRVYARSVFYEINIGIRSLLWMVLFYAPPSAVFGVALFFLSGNEELSRTALMTATSGIFLSIVLFILATLFYAACVCRYSLTPYLIAEDADLTVRKAIKLSVKYTKGFRFSILWFALSYIGWFFLAAFLFPAMYVVPYYSTGIAMYSRYIIEKNRNPVSDTTQEFSANTEELEIVSEEEKKTDL